MLTRRTVLSGLIVGCFTPNIAVAREDVGHKVGIASWYGGRWHGKKTASGERFDKNAYTAAYNNAPFGQVLRVSDLKTGRTVFVTVNDRLGNKKRMIDLSERAALKLDLAHRGIGFVRIEKV